GRQQRADRAAEPGALGRQVEGEQQHPEGLEHHAEGGGADPQQVVRQGRQVLRQAPGDVGQLLDQVVLPQVRPEGGVDPSDDLAGVSGEPLDEVGGLQGQQRPDAAEEPGAQHPDGQEHHGGGGAAAPPVPGQPVDGRFDRERQEQRDQQEQQQLPQPLQQPQQ